MINQKLTRKMARIINKKNQQFQIWMSQRKFLIRKDGLNGFIITVLVTALLNHRVLTKHMSSYQVIVVFVFYFRVFAGFFPLF